MSGAGYRGVLVSGEVLEEMFASSASVRKALSGIRPVVPMRRLRLSSRANNRIDCGASPGWEGCRLQVIRVLSIPVHDPRGERCERLVRLAPELSDDGFVVVQGARRGPAGHERALHECRGRGHIRGVVIELQHQARNEARDLDARERHAFSRKRSLSTRYISRREGHSRKATRRSLPPAVDPFYWAAGELPLDPRDVDLPKAA